LKIDKCNKKDWVKKLIHLEGRDEHTHSLKNVNKMCVLSKEKEGVVMEKKKGPRVYQPSARKEQNNEK